MTSVGIESLFAVVGAGVLALLFNDVLLTVFHPRRHGGPVHRRQNRALWHLFRWASGHLPEPLNQRMLSLGGPLIAVLSVGSWGLWLVLGFAFVCFPYRADLSSGLIEELGWSDVLYFSGYVVSTLGVGDVVPSSPGLRLLTVVAAMSGFALFAVATAYLLAVYQHVAKEHVLAVELATLLEYSRGTEDGDRVGFESPEVAAWAQTASRRFFEIAQAHGQYPVLHYFRPVDHERALVVQVGRMLRLPMLRRVHGWPGYQLTQAVRRYVRGLESGCLPMADRSQPAGRASDSWARLEIAHGRLLRYMRYGDG